MSSLTILVPRAGRDSDFETTLASILRYSLPHHQVVVSQHAVDAEHYGLENEVKFVTAPGKGGLGSLLNAAIPEISGETLNIIHPGVEVSNQWFAAGIRQLRNSETGCVAVPLVASHARQTVLSRGICPTSSMYPRHIQSSRRSPAGPSCWAGFYRTRVLRQLGPVDEHLGSDVFGLDLGLSLAELGYRCAVADDQVLTVREANWLKIKPSRSAGRDAQRMVQRYQPDRLNKPVHWIATSVDVATSLFRPGRLALLAGRVAARKSQPTDDAHREHLAAVRCQVTAGTGPKPTKRAA